MIENHVEFHRNKIKSREQMSNNKVNFKLFIPEMSNELK
jgi:hypothetical protein